MSVGVEARKQNQSGSTCDCSNDSKDRERLLPPRGVWCEVSCMSEPALRDHTEIEEDDHDGRAGNEERFVLVCARV